MKPTSYCLEVWGPFACFTRPEMKVERVSYDVITPSAARAIFESILWKPAIIWRIDRIEVLSPIQWLNIRRNEVGKVANASPLNLASNRGFFIEEERQQRAALILRDVRYRIYGHLELTRQADSQDSLVKYQEMFARRAQSGQCVNQPYLGCREFACYFRLVNPDKEAATPITETRDLGFMVFDTCELEADKNHRERQYVLQLFRAKLENGVLDNLQQTQIYQ